MDTQLEVEPTDPVTSIMNRMTTNEALLQKKETKFWKKEAFKLARKLHKVEHELLNKECAEFVPHECNGLEEDKVILTLIAIFNEIEERWLVNFEKRDVFLFHIRNNLNDKIMKAVDSGSNEWST